MCAKVYLLTISLISIALVWVLGPIAESELRRALSMSQGDFSIFIERPISATLLSIAFLLLAVTLITPLIKRARRKTTT